MGVLDRNDLGAISSPLNLNASSGSGGGSSGATPALDNLASTAVNVDLTPVQSGYTYQIWESTSSVNYAGFINKSAFRFTPSHNIKLKTVTFSEIRNNLSNQSNTSKVVVYGTSGGLPNLSDVKGGSPTRLNSSIASSEAQAAYTFASAIALTAGVSYWISLEETGSAYSLTLRFANVDTPTSTVWRSGVSLETLVGNNRSPLHTLTVEGVGSPVALGTLLSPYSQIYASALRLPNATRSRSASLVASANLASDLTWTMPTTLGTSGQPLTQDGAGNLYWGSVPATNTLNNLGTTSINADLLPSANQTRSLGSALLTWNALHAQRVAVAGTIELDSRTMPSGGTAYSLGNVALSQSVGLMTINGSNASTTGSVRIESGNNTGSGASGDIKLFAGTTASGARGKVEMTAAKIDASGSTGPFRVPVLAADPASPLDGEVWYNSTDNKMRIRANGVTVNLN